ncbi:hypothetical protein AMAG_03728 [Allomyces macrogynus ATCC 38327]|uniref:Uncharacterized protein n=1 Tax=Allomyces macrogynus (strain ATCC 38327) TaxID=578462 RepID=A0A0L0SA31_ALLM3|nr:hypothetical protein AMAG_03728 [Allomyces macrogynus ATCC 38327]|eukprot:KNE59448.1 hypothetical protein AMAG_03728 [Allomyces macrogynus ATCC 38327]
MFGLRAPSRRLAAAVLATRAARPRALATTSALPEGLQLPETGSIPAFDEAIKVLQAANAAPATKDLPTVWAFRYAAGDFSKPEFRQLGLDHFVKHRRPRVIQFAEQRGVFQDFFPKREDEINVEVHLAARGEELIKMGSDLAPLETTTPPAVYIQPFHAEEKKYTFVLLDADKVRPDLEMQSEEILWMVKDIPLSASTATAPLNLPTAADATTGTVGHLVLPYVPPHPTKGSGTHRVVALVLEQPAADATESADAAAAPTTSLPRQVAVWDLVQAQGLTPRGLLLWKTEWDTTVSDVFRNVLKEREPRFVTRPKIGRKGVDGLIGNKYQNV